MYGTFVFDVDGTLINTEDALIKSLRRAVEETTGEIIENENLRPLLGIPEVEVLNRLGLQGDERRTVQDKWAAYLEENRFLIDIFPGIQELLEGLNIQGYQVGIVTSKTREAFDHEMKPFGLQQFASYIISAEDTTHHKPSPEPLRAFMEKSGTEASNTIYIGDTQHDSDSAEKAGTAFGLAGWGAVHPENTSPTLRFERPEEILEYVTNAPSS
ncbi:hypothetical protein CHL76_00250 [Marinococcus halophilus]|uniref:Phosphatase n=1 Tax=Marinococcus halophilus TaxID=1371 RepID=A0A510Y2G3_MARHA|nr:HAD family hydrolase [Marinococcus halophilus]OZT81563.1 hypothetical protein CHL76_00250 [Marinococcus halophilus]GEK57506.1 phosphatase [Marinococcus halophilus]